MQRMCVHALLIHRLAWLLGVCMYCMGGIFFLGKGNTVALFVDVHVHATHVCASIAYSSTHTSLEIRMCFLILIHLLVVMHTDFSLFACTRGLMPASFLPGCVPWCVWCALVKVCWGVCVCPFVHLCACVCVCVSLSGYCLCMGILRGVYVCV